MAEANQGFSQNYQIFLDWWNTHVRGNPDPNAYKVGMAYYQEMINREKQSRLVKQAEKAQDTQNLAQGAALVGAPIAQALGKKTAGWLGLGEASKVAPTAVNATTDALASIAQGGDAVLATPDSLGFLDQTSNFISGQPLNAVSSQALADGTAGIGLADGTVVPPPTGGIASVLPYAGAALGAYGLYDLGKDHHYKGDYGKAALQGGLSGAGLASGLGSILGASAGLGPVGLALGALYGLGMKQFGSSKSQSQVVRDSFRDALEEQGVLEYKKNKGGHMSHHLNVQGGPSFDVGREDTREGTAYTQDALSQLALPDYLAPGEKQSFMDTFGSRAGKDLHYTQLTPEETLANPELLKASEAFSSLLSGGAKELDPFG